VNDDAITAWLDEVVCRLEGSNVRLAQLKAESVLRDLDRLLKPVVHFPENSQSDQVVYAANQLGFGIDRIGRLRDEVGRGVLEIKRGNVETGRSIFREAVTNWLGSTPHRVLQMPRT
jgi:hypothetical protein